jgi:hypothetical protein
MPGNLAGCFYQYSSLLHTTAFTLVIQITAGKRKDLQLLFDRKIELANFINN